MPINLDTHGFPIDLDAGIISAAGTRAEAVQEALLEVPRDAFVSSLPVAHGQVVGHSMPAASTLRRMLEALEVQENARVLQIGTGSGYAAAVASRLAKTVYSVDRLLPLVDSARKHFEALGYDNIRLRHGDGWIGWPDEAPFDAILVLASARQFPSGLLGQLKIGGRMVLATGTDRLRQQLLRVTRLTRDDFKYERLEEVGFGADPGDGELDLASVSPEVMAEASRRVAAGGRSLEAEVRSVIRAGETKIVEEAARRHGVAVGDVSRMLAAVDLAVADGVPRAFLDHYHLLPWQREGDRIDVAVTDPETPVGDLEKVFPGCTFKRHLVTPTDFRRIWTILDLRRSDVQRGMATEVVAGRARDLVAHDDGALETRAVELFEALMLDAIAERASDLHLERYGERVRVRLRIDGELRDLERIRLTPADLRGVLNVLKVRSNLDITEHRRPMGGRIRLHAGGIAFDLRVQTQPTLHGEHAVVRLLPQESSPLTVADLGMPPELALQYHRLLESPSGLVLVVGPTGCGKTTTLYAGVQELARDSRLKVITVEDPIEYVVDGIQQTQVQPEIGFSFANAMRSFVRQDPDVILVGEIRDTETALEAIRASQTGHLVLATLHCNDTVDAVQRLFDLGLHPNSIASELLAVIAQRLSKRLCDDCKKPATPDPGILAELFPKGQPEGFRCFTGTGCDKCGGHGTRGRIGVFEFLRATPDLRRAISHHASLDDLREVALAAGLATLRDGALAHVLEGRMELRDLPRILPAERMAPDRVR